MARGQGAMELTEKELRDRGIQRSPEEIAEEARRFVFHVILEMPTGRWATEPGKEFSEVEAMTLEEGGLDLSPQEEGGPDPLARTAAKYVALLASALTTKEAAGCSRSAKAAFARG